MKRFSFKENKVVSIYSFSFYFFLPFPWNFSWLEFSQLTAIDDFGNPPFWDLQLLIQQRETFPVDNKQINRAVSTKYYTLMCSKK